MSVVIFTKSSIEAAGTPATGLSYYQPFTISPFYVMGFLTGLSAWGLAMRPFLLSAPYYQPFLSHGLCYRPFPVIGLLTTSPFCRMGSATGRFLLSAPYYQPFLSHGLCYRLFPVIGPLLPAFFHRMGSATGRFLLPAPCHQLFFVS